MDIFVDLLCACVGKRIVFSNLQKPKLTLIASFQLFFRVKHRFSDEDERDVSSSSGNILRQLDTVAGSGSLIMWLQDAYGAAVENVNGRSSR